METTVFLERGMGFGEHALRHDGPRQASVHASEFTEVLVTTRATYETYAGASHRLFIGQRVQFLRHCKRIADALQSGALTSKDVGSMADCLSESYITANALAFKQGDAVDRIIFVRSGTLLLLRTVDEELPSGDLGPDPEFGSKQPSKRRQFAEPVDETLQRESSFDGKASVAQRKSRARIGLISERKQARMKSLLRLNPEAMLSEEHALDDDDDASSMPYAHRTTAGFLPAASSSSAPARRRHLFQVGTICPHHFFGDQQIISGDVCPASVICDSVAEIYELSKHDMLRKLPKRVLNALFYIEKELEVSDQQLIEINRQTKRWDDYRKGVLAEFAPRDRDGDERSTFLGLKRARAVPVDIARNLEFLGVSTSSKQGRSLQKGFEQDGRNTRSVALSDKEKEYFSDAPSDFVRGLRKVKRDEGLRMAYKRAGKNVAVLVDESDGEDKYDASYPTANE
jgi:CRP-like cAMP-binding protein